MHIVYYIYIYIMYIIIYIYIYILYIIYIDTIFILREKSFWSHAEEERKGAGRNSQIR